MQAVAVAGTPLPMVVVPLVLLAAVTGMTVNPAMVRPQERRTEVPEEAEVETPHSTSAAVQAL
jgi:hypothetical protein